MSSPTSPPADDVGAGDKGEERVLPQINLEKLTTGQTIRLFLWNPEEKACLGRNGFQWVSILVFYAFLYTFFVFFFMTLLQVALCFYGTREPHLMLGDSIIGESPGLSYRPSMYRKSLTWYKRSEPSTYKDYLDELDVNVNDSTNYNKVGNYNEKQLNLIDCEKNSLEEALKKNKSSVCNMKHYLEKMKHCTRANKYGYDKGEPCFLIRNNKIFNWVPGKINWKNQVEDDKETKKKGKILPKELEEKFNQIKGGPKQEGGHAVGIYCRGLNEADRENFKQIHYEPHEGISSNYFPFNGQHGYKVPYVLIWVEKPRIGFMVNIICMSIFNLKGMDDKVAVKSGTVIFQFIID